MEGPISFGLVVHDKNDQPILYIDEVRQILFDFAARKVNSQLDQLLGKNPNAFIFIDEPGMQFIFSALSGYGDIQAKDEINSMLANIRGKQGIHLCGNPGWDFLLDLDIDILSFPFLSFNAYDRGDVFAGYEDRIKRFLNKGALLHGESFLWSMRIAIKKPLIRCIGGSCVFWITFPPRVLAET